jgi:glycogen operon protein
VLSQVKLIAEPWDVGENGFHVGNFPAGWMEWNAKYRDCMREYWKGDNATLPEFANRITGSSDLYLDNWRTPVASINFITAHDGFTLMDLVSYNEKHNEANGDNNQDGESNNRSFNYGAEGPTDDEEINNIRKRQVLNFLTTLFLSQGVPMLVAGDELGRTQMGNNNAYCQDNEISWINWDAKDEKILEFTSNLIGFRLSHPAFCRNKWFQHRLIKGIKDIEWFIPKGTVMTDQSWNESLAKSLGIFLSGANLNLKDEHGETLTDDTFYIIFNSNPESVIYTLPDSAWGKLWYKILDTYDCFFDSNSEEFPLKPLENIEARGRSVIMLISRQKDK